MWLKPVPNQQIQHSVSKVPVLICPFQGHSQEEVINQLQKLDAENIQIPAPGFISTEISPDSIKEIESLATVEIKPKYRMRNRNYE
jgi:hypothetical protein